MTPEERIKSNTKYIQPCCDAWKHLLGLDEWQVVTEISDKENIGGQTGKLSFSRSNGQALISLLDKDDVIVNPFGFDQEENLVKQLLSLRFEMVTSLDVTNEIYFRRAIKVLAHTLVELKRKSDAYDRIIAEMDPTEETKKPDSKPAPKPAKKPKVIG